MEDVKYTQETIKNIGVNFEDLWYSFDGDIILDKQKMMEESHFQV
jgi:hypothetical protein